MGLMSSAIRTERKGNVEQVPRSRNTMADGDVLRLAPAGR